MRFLHALLGMLPLACTSEVIIVSHGAPPADADAGDAAQSPPPDPSGDAAAPPTDAAMAPDTSHASCAKSPDAHGTTSRSAAGNPYYSYVPASYDKSKPSALVVALHGAGDTAQNYLQWMWQANADARGVIVIAPEGTYPYSGGYAWNGGDDSLVLAALDDVQKCYSIDPKHVVINGFSAGGTMAYFIGLANASRFSGLAIQSSSLSSGEYVAGGSLLPAAWKVPVSHFHGDADMNFPIANAKQGIDTLQAAGHPVFWHPFSGGHQATAADALTELDDLAKYAAP